MDDIPIAVIDILIGGDLLLNKGGLWSLVCIRIGCKPDCSQHAIIGLTCFVVCQKGLLRDFF